MPDIFESFFNAKPTVVDALGYLKRTRRPVTRAKFDELFPGMFADLYAAAWIGDYRGSDGMFRVVITDTGRAELAWRTM